MRLSLDFGRPLCECYQGPWQTILIECGTSIAEINLFKIFPANGEDQNEVRCSQSCQVTHVKRTLSNILSTSKTPFCRFLIIWHWQTLPPLSHEWLNYVNIGDLWCFVQICYFLVHLVVFSSNFNLQWQPEIVLSCLHRHSRFCPIIYSLLTRIRKSPPT